MGKFRCIIVFIVSMLIVCFSLNSHARSNKHIRVILDTSASMKGYGASRAQDPGKLSVLSVALLLDLALKDLSLSRQAGNTDSFHLIPFDNSYREWKKNSSPPKSTISPIKLSVRRGNRARFMKKLKNLKRNGRRTYFYPGLKRTADELKKTRNGLNDVRTIILITDGISDNAVDDRAKLATLVDEMAIANIKVYVLMFGNGANNTSFFQAIEHSSTGVNVSTFKSVQTADSLLTAMLDIFVDRFGYQVNQLQDASSTRTLDLANNSSLSKVAVVNLVNKPQLPAFNLSPPLGKSLNDDPQIISETIIGENNQSGGGYSLHWVSNPANGNHGYQLSANIANIKIAVLRPVEYIIQDDLMSTPSLGAIPIYSVMAKGDSKMYLQLITSSAGAAGNDIKLKYSAFSTDSGAEWTDGQQADNITSVMPAYPGQYKINAVFKEHPYVEKKNQKYTATLEAEAFKNQISVSRGGGKRFSLQVFPYLKFNAQEASVSINGELKKGDRECRQFKIKKVEGYWYEHNSPGINASLSLKNTLTTVKNNEFNEVKFTLDGRPVMFNQNTTLNATYQDGFLLTDSGDKEHEFCIHMGRPINVAQNSKVELVLNLFLTHKPYDRYKVINPVTFKMTIAEAYIKWWQFLFFLLPLLLLWYLRNVPKIEDDLRYRFFPINNKESPLLEFGTGSPLRAALNITQKYDILNPEDHAVIGGLKPVHKTLFQLTFKNSIVKGSGDQVLEMENNTYWLKANHDYFLTREGQNFIFRIEYE